MKKSFNILLLLFSFLYSINLGSCTFLPFMGCASRSFNPSVPIQTLLSAPKELEIEGNKFRLGAYFQLNASTYNYNRDRCLSGSIIVNTVSNIKFPKAYIIERLWLVNEKYTWETSLANYPAQDTINIDSGPEWDNGQLNAVVKITDPKQKSFFLKSEGFFVHAISG